MSESFTSKVTAHFDPSSPSPSPASASTSTLISPYPISHLSKGDLEVGEENPPTIPTSTVFESRDTTTPIVSTFSTPIDTPTTPLSRPQPQNMTFPPLNLHAQSISHSIFHRDGPSKGFGVGQTGQGDDSEVKMSSRGFVQPHRNHLPRRVKQKNVAPKAQATSTPDLTSTPFTNTQDVSGSSQSPHAVEHGPATLPTPPHLVVGSISATITSGSSIVDRNVASAKLESSANSTPSSPSAPNSSISTLLSSPSPPPPLAAQHGTTDAPKSSVLATPPALTPRPDRRPYSSPSPLGPNLPRRKVSKQIPPLPLSHSVIGPGSVPPASTPSLTPARTGSPAQVPTPSSRPGTPLRSSLRKPGKTPLRSAAALAESPFVSSSSESGSDSEGEGGRGKGREKAQNGSGSPWMSKAAVVGLTPARTPAQDVPLVPIPAFVPVPAGEGRSKRRRPTFALPFPIHGEPRSQTPADGQAKEEVARTLPARLAVASLRGVPAKADQKCTQYVGAGVYVGFFEDHDNGHESFWDVPAVDDAASRKSTGLDEDDTEIKRLRQIVLRVLSDEEDADEVFIDVVQVQEPDDVNSHLTSTPVSTSAASGGERGCKGRREDPERELVLTLPTPISSSSSERVLKGETGAAGSFGGCGYVDGMTVLDHAQMHQAWTWMRGWMNRLEEEEEEEGTQEQENGEEEVGGIGDYVPEVERTRRARSRSRARSTTRKEGIVVDGKSRSKSRRRAERCLIHGSRRRRRRRRANIQIEIQSPRERREDAMAIATGYLCLASSASGLPIEELRESLNHEHERPYTSLHLLWMRLMDVGVRLDDHGDDHYFGKGGNGRRRSRSRNRHRSQSRPRQVDDVDLRNEDEHVNVDVKMPPDQNDVELASQVVSKSDEDAQIEHELDPIPAFRFNTRNLYPPSSSSRSSLCSDSDHCSGANDGEPCGYTDEDQPSDSALDDGEPAKGYGRVVREGGGPVDGDETGEQITLHDIRDEWRGVFSFDGLRKVWETVEAFRSA